MGDLLLSLPNELQIQIVAPLPLSTILNLRRVSKSYHAFITLNESPIVRYHTRHNIPQYTIRCYPLPPADDISLRHLCGIFHRLHVSTELARLIAEKATKEIFLRATEAQRIEFMPQHKRMRRRLVPLIFIIFHFYERYRELHVQHLMEGKTPLVHQAFTINPIERAVMNSYDDDTLLRAHQVYPLVVSSFTRRLRPPSYVGRFERSIKGYLRDKPADDVYAAILAVGGLHQAEKFWHMKGYNARRAAVDVWYESLARDAVDMKSKAKKSILPHLGRKKGTEAATTDIACGHDPATCREWYCMKPACTDGVKSRPVEDMIYHTSLADGPPMLPLARHKVAMLLADLQPLQHMWMHTAEALLLDRGVVESAEKIKRNTQVLLELIRDDGRVEEEDWVVGTTTIDARDTIHDHSGSDSEGATGN